MASTLKPTVFSIKIKETHVVSDIRTVNENLYRIDNVTNYDRRVVTCPNTTSIDLINVNGVNPGAGTFPSSSLKYGRITNLDDTYSLAVNFTSSAGVGGILYPAKELYPASYTGGGEGGTPGTYNNGGAGVATTGGTGTGATFNVVTNNSAGKLVINDTVAVTSNITNASSDGTTGEIFQNSSSGGGTGAKFTVRTVGGVVSDVTIKGNGSGYSINETITFTAAALTADGNLGTVTGDLTVRVSSANILVEPTSIIVNNQGSGYSVNDALTINGATDLGGSDNLVITLGATDFTTNTSRSYWTMDCLPTSSLMFSSPNVTGSQFIGSFGQDIEFISVYAISSSIDVEYVIVNA
jgi:hypothetical protein